MRCNMFHDELLKYAGVDMCWNERRCVALGRLDSTLLRIVPDANHYQCSQKHTIQL